MISGVGVSMFGSVLLIVRDHVDRCGGPPLSLYGRQIDEVARILRRFKSALRRIRHMIVPVTVR
jgi:hypothetical protein